jgi:hypothetical protein
MKASLPDLSSRPRRGGGLQRLDVALLTVALLAFLLSAFSAWRARSELSQATEATSRARGEAEAARLTAQKARLASRRSGETWVPAVLLLGESPPPQVIEDLAELLPGEVRVEALTLHYADEISLDMSVTAVDAAAYDRFMDSLVLSPRFVNLRPGPEGRRGELRLSLHATYRKVSP